MAAGKFTGSTEYRMDERNRVPMPPRWRAEFDGPAFMTLSKDPCIAVYNQSGFDAAAARVEAIPADSAQGRHERRRFYGNVFQVNKDTQGRLVLEKPLIEYAGLDRSREVRVVGVGEWFEIWDRARHEAFDPEATAEGSE